MAGQALNGLLAHDAVNEVPETSLGQAAINRALAAYAYADVMLKERAK